MSVCGRRLTAAISISELPVQRVEDVARWPPGEASVFRLLLGSAGQLSRYSDATSQVVSVKVLSRRIF